MEVKLCDNEGMVSHEKVFPKNPFNRELTYMEQFNNLRRLGRHGPYEGDPFACTGSAHLGAEHIRCTNDAVHLHGVSSDCTHLFTHAHLVVVCPLCRAGTFVACEHVLSRQRAALRLQETLDAGQ
jgi:hypothetical protein